MQLTAAAQRLLKPKKIPDTESVSVMLKRWEPTLTDPYEQAGEEVMHDVTRRELMVSIVPEDVHSRLRDVLELHPNATIPQLRSIILNRVKCLLGTAEAEKDAMELDALKDTKPELPEPEPYDDPAGAWQGDGGADCGGDSDSFGWKATGAATATRMGKTGDTKGKGKGDVDPNTGRDSRGRFTCCAVCGELDDWARESPDKDNAKDNGSRTTTAEAKACVRTQ